MKKIRVLFIIGGDDDKYGAQQLAKNILSSMRTKDNVEFCVLTTHHGLVNFFCDEKGIQNHIYNFRYCTYVPLENKILNLFKHIIKKCLISFKNFYAIRKIESEIDIKSFDIIHSNINRDLIGGFLSRKYNKPHIWHLQEMYDSHFVLCPIYKNQIEWMNSHCSRFIAISNAVKDDWAKHGIDESKIEVIYNGIDIGKYKIKEPGKSNHLLKIVMAGLIYKEKGQEQVIKALTLLPKEIRENIRLDLYGDVKKKYYSYLSELIKDKGLQNIVTFKGYSKDMPNTLSKYNVGINCSKSEGFGLSTLEYMASGLCVLATSSGANTELIQDNKNGLLIEYGNPASIAEKLKEIYFDKEERQKLGKAAQESARQFSIDACAEKIYDTYSSVKG